MAIKRKNRIRGVRRKGRNEAGKRFNREQLRDWPSKPYREQRVPSEFRDLLTVELLPHLAFTGRKIPEQHRLATHCLHNAVRCGVMGYCVGDTRNNSLPGVRLRVRAWDALEDAGFVVKQLGSEVSAKQTRYLATDSLLAHFHQFPSHHLTNTQLVRNTTTPDEPSWDALVVLKESRKDGGKVLPFPEDELNATLGGVSVGAYLKGVEDDIEFINRANLRHSWEAFKELPNGGYRAVQPNVCLKQLHIKHILRYARLYTWGTSSAQNFSEHERSTMRIDRVPVVEFDYAQHNIRILYHILRIDPPHDLDLYYPEKVLPGACRDSRTKTVARKFVKLATNIMLNVTSRNEAIQGAQGLLFKGKYSRFFSSMLRREGITASGAVDRISDTHPEVADRFFTQIGAELQTIDGKIMRKILMAFSKEDRPVLGIHDSVVCRVSDADFAEAMMKREYRSMLDFRPVVRRVY